MKSKGDMGIGFTALVAAFLLGYSVLKGKSISDIIFMREGTTTPEGAEASSEEAGSPSVTGGPTTSLPAKLHPLVGWINSVSGKYDYAWGGGHHTIGQPSQGGLNGPGGRTVNGFDCSGFVSGALHAAGLLNQPLTSGELMKWGVSGTGRYLTVYCNPDHTFLKIGNAWAGTGHIGKGGGGPAWGNKDQTVTYAARHWPGL